MTLAAIRAFNRRYTAELGLLGRTLPGCDLPLAEARLLYELAQGEEPCAAAIGQALAMDKAQLSRIAGRFEARGWIERAAPRGRGGRRRLSLTPTGRMAFAAINAATDADLAARLARLPGAAVEELAALLARAEAIIAPPTERALAFTPLQVGDLGTVIARQAALYHTEYGWTADYEALVAKILGAFAEHFDPARDHAWIARLNGAMAGSIFLVRGDAPDAARLRLLYVEPWARGHGLGARLVALCVARARELGYARLELWTNSVLASARRIYQTQGFVLAREEPHHSFGHDLVGQIWTRDLAHDG